MGFLDRVTAAFRRPQSLVAEAPAPAAAPTKEVGISGVSNYSGRLIYEPIAALREQAGYGRAGTYEWGFWEDLSAANSFVAAALDFVMAPVADARISIEMPTPGIIPDALAQEMTDFLRWNFTEKLQLGSFNAQCALGFLKTGFSIFEPVYALNEKGQWYCSQLPERLPMSLHVNPWMEVDGKLQAIKQMGTRGSMFAEPILPADRVLLGIWKRQGTNWAGRSAFRAVQYIAGYTMPMLLKLIGVTLQREGAGIPIAEATDKDTPLNENQRQDLVTLMSSLVFHESASAVMPAGWQLKWTFSGGANKGHVMEVWRELGTVVLQQLGAQQLQLGTGSTGSRSVGEVHDARAAATVKSVLRVLEAVLNGDDGEPFQGLAPRICRFNWGNLPAYPRVRLTMQHPELPVADLTAAIASAVTAKVFTVTLDDENVVRERLGFEPIDENQRKKALDEAQARQPPMIIGQPPVPGQPGVKVPPSPPGKSPVEPDGDEEPEPDGDEAKLKASAQRGGWQPWRPLRASEQRTNFSAINEYFTKQRDDFANRARPLVVAMIGQAAPAIEKACADGKLTPAEVAALPLNSKRLDLMIAKFLAEVRAAGKTSTRDELRKSSAPLTAASAGDPTQEADAVVDAQTRMLSDRMLNRLRGEIGREALDTLRQSGDAQEVVDRAISRQLDTGAFKADAGSATTRVFNVGRDEAAKMMGGVASVEYSAILDSNTCDACEEADGETAAFDSAEHDALLPPNRDCAGGDNCRCVLVFIPGEPGDFEPGDEPTSGPGSDEGDDE